MMPGTHEALAILAVGVVLLSTTTLGRWYSITYERDTENYIPKISKSESCAYVDPTDYEIHIDDCATSMIRHIVCQDISVDTPSECINGSWKCDRCLKNFRSAKQWYPSNDCYSVGFSPATTICGELRFSNGQLYIGYYGGLETSQQPVGAFTDMPWYHPVFEENQVNITEQYYPGGCVTLDLTNVGFLGVKCYSGDSYKGLCTPINNDFDTSMCPGKVIAGTCYWLSGATKFAGALTSCMRKGGVLAVFSDTKSAEVVAKDVWIKSHNIRYLWLGIVGYQSVGKPSNNNNQAPGAGESGDNQAPGPGESGDGLSSGEGSTVWIKGSTGYTKKNGDVATTTGLVYIGGQGTTKGQRNTDGQGLISDVSTTGSPDNIHDVTTTGGRDTAMNTTDDSNCCFCFLVPEFSAAIVRDKVEGIKKKLIVPRKNLSASIRKRTSAPDDRSSSVQIGTTAIIIVSVIFSAIVLPDVVTLVVAIKVSILK